MKSLYLPILSIFLFGCATTASTYKSGIKFEGENVKDILSFLVKVLDFSQFELRSKVIEVDYLGNVVSIEHRGKK